MTYNKLVNGKVIPMTPEEIAARQAEEAAWLAEKPMKEWLDRMAATDSKVPRYLEDIIDALDAPTRNRMGDHISQAYAEKKRIRSERP